MSENIVQLHNTDPASLKADIVDAINQRIDNLEKSLNPIRTEWISRKQASTLLGVSLVTIHEWSKKEILKPYRIGNRVRFKLEEIENTLNGSRDESISGK
ncbi:MAG TPA: DNA-binding protein [Flavobacteriaceae bacterium]|nr:DNA-binding protein [Flavobacteriaceae bacterium]MAY53996.1 DNA-binding protein [Flavobacteriaceae bacterium]HBR53911.1 DNA-binding protein [Flavobacteriaceae bacterium]|tara:strand:+ start:2070 stop:2369 length:300 start_codon:yes stop_codon:yes gene_type:complete